MKKRRVVKLLSVGMASILAISPCNMTGNVVYAQTETIQEEQNTEIQSEKAKEEVQSEEVTESEEMSTVEESKGKKEENSTEADSEESEAENTEENESIEEETTEEETTEEGTTEEETTEEETTESVEEEVALFGLASESVVLTQFYEKELEFDHTSTWSDQGESHLGLKSEKALNSGATVSFDMYIPEEKADYNGVIKVQGIARLGDNWTWTENTSIPEFISANLIDTVEVDGKLYKKISVSFSFGDEITADYLAEFTVKLAGWNCNYKGNIYYANVELKDGETKQEDTDKVATNAVYQWDFAEGIDGWYFDGVWDNKGENSIAWNEKYQALAMNVDYSNDMTSTWSEIKSSFWNDDFAVDGVNKVIFDFIYDSAELQTGSFKTKFFSDKGSATVDTNTTINLDNAQEYEGTLKKAEVTLEFDNTDLKKGLTIGIIGSETDYQGVVYLDNVTLIAEKKASEEDIFVDARETVTGQNIQLSVQGDTLTTGAGSTTISRNITLVDADASDSVKQVYAYLQAVGKTDSVIFGQQNNTSHKAGVESLSCSDTMDLVGSYTGIIGLDGLSLVGDEYSAERYLGEMAEIDSAYGSVSAKIANAQTTIEKNVIAAAALTNFNIRNGAIATLSLHTPNLSLVEEVMAPVDAPSYAGYNFSGYTPGVLTGDVMNQILPGGAYNTEFTAYLDMVADYAKQVDGAILFRPFHENTGSWFWWGAAFCDAQTYKSVFKYTVEYLRDEKDVHNLLYVYGPGSEAANVEEYAERYPGDGYVDMVGFDMYHDNPTQGDSFIANFTKELSVVESFAKAHGKLVAVTETGVRHDVQDGDNQTALKKNGNARLEWHQEILDVVKASEASYYLVWANFSERDGFYTPYVKYVKEDGVKHGHEMMDNFIRFFNQDNSIFAVNQKQALEQMKSVPIQVEAAIKQDGYVVSPVAGIRVLEEATLTAKVSGTTIDDCVTFICKGVGEKCELKAEYANGYAIAILDKDSLDKMGETVGEIALQINGKTVDTIKVTFNIPVPAEDPYEIDGFENYFGIDTLLTKSWATNKATGSTITLSVVQDKVKDGDYAMKFTYNETSDGWAGATISKEVSWADCDALSFWTVPDGKLQKTVIQITANGNVYEYYMNLNEDYVAAGTKAIKVTIPFAEFVARDITGNPVGGLVKDKGSITSFGLWVNAIAGSDAVDESGMVTGTIYYDSITAVSAGLETAKIVLAEEAEVKPIIKPQNPLIDNGNTSSKKHDTNGNEATVTFADSKVFPTFTSVNGKKVSGWENVITAAYELAELTAARVPLANAFDTTVDRLIVNINVADVTELVIPAVAVRKMAVSGADYNIFMGAKVITLTNEILTGVEGSLDLKLYEKVVKDFGEGFDAMFVSSRTRHMLNGTAYMNVVLGKEKTGKQAYIYQFVEEKQVYELQTVQTISEIGTICVSIDDYASCLILY